MANSKRNREIKLKRARAFDLFRIQAGRCFYCLTPINSSMDFTLDHVVPISHGGPDNQYNIVLSCHSCNTAFGNCSVKMKILWMLRFRPTREVESSRAEN